MPGETGELFACHHRLPLQKMARGGAVGKATHERESEQCPTQAMGVGLLPDAVITTTTTGTRQQQWQHHHPAATLLSSCDHCCYVFKHDTETEAHTREKTEGLDGTERRERRTTPAQACHHPGHIKGGESNALEFYSIS